MLPIQLTPERFELEVKAILEATGVDMASFQAAHREQLEGIDGVYEIDVTVRFRALGAEFLILVECKHQQNPVKRDVVQILHDRIRSTGAHKGMLFATTTFQSGAIAYATKHGIALVRMAEGASSWATRAAGPPTTPPPWAKIPSYIGWRVCHTQDGNERIRIMSKQDPEHCREFLFDCLGSIPSASRAACRLRTTRARSKLDR